MLINVPDSEFITFSTEYEVSWITPSGRKTVLLRTDDFEKAEQFFENSPYHDKIRRVGQKLVLDIIEHKQWERDENYKFPTWRRYKASQHFRDNSY